MSKQLHKNFVDEQVKLLLKSYMDKEIKINYILSILGIKRSRFFELLNRYKKDPDNFSIQYNRKTINRKIDKAIELNIRAKVTYTLSPQVRVRLKDPIGGFKDRNESSSKVSRYSRVFLV